jgi:hypothetical protein
MCKWVFAESYNIYIVMFVSSGLKKHSKWLAYGIIVEYSLMEIRPP